jgi:hypothetical protein
MVGMEKTILAWNVTSCLSFTEINMVKRRYLNRVQILTPPETPSWLVLITFTTGIIIFILTIESECGIVGISSLYGEPN